MADHARTNLDDFNAWVADMDDALERFLQRLPEALRRKMNYSPESLDDLENWLLARYPSKDMMLVADQSRTVDGVARYIGETFRKNAGGHWDIELKDPKAAFFAVPFLKGFRTPICPLALATAAASRRKPGFIQKVLQNNLGRKPAT